MKCMVTTNQNVWSIQMKCMVIISQIYSHYKSSYIQFLTLGGSHKPSKIPFLASYMTYLPKQLTSLHFLLLVSHMTCLYKPSKLPFLVGHMTCLSKHLISLQILLFSRSYNLIMSSIKYPFLDFFFRECLVGHQNILFWPVTWFDYISTPTYSLFSHFGGACDLLI